MKVRQLMIALLVSLLMVNLTHAMTLDDEIASLQKQWAIANYETAETDLEKTFDELTKKAEQVVTRYSDKAEPLIWNAIILSSDAGKNGGLSALGKVKKARDLLLEAEKINPQALNGSIYTSLGSLYYQVPGWPLGFGDDKQAKTYLKKALSINPDGIDPNFFYGDFLLEEGKTDEAKKYLNKALNAPDRPERALADKGRRNEIKTRLKTIDNQ